MRTEIFGFTGLRRELEVGKDTLLKWMAIYNFPKPENIHKRNELKVWSKPKVVDWVWQNQSIVDKYWAKMRNEDEC